MKKIHYGWIVCGACTVLTMCTMGLVNNCFSVYLPYILSENGFSSTIGSSLITARTLFSLVGMLLVSRYYRRLGLRFGLALACGLTACSFFLYAAAHSLLMFYAASALSGLCYGFGSMIPVSILINRWFVRRRAFALSMCATGTSYATLLFPPLIAGLINAYSVKIAFLAEAVWILCISLLVFVLVRATPDDMGLAPYGAGEDPEAEKRRVSASAPVLNRVQWGLLYLALTLLGAVTISSSNHLSILFTTEGYGSMLSALSVSVFGLFLTVGKFLYGLITDRVGGRNSISLFSLLTIVGLLVCALAPLQQDWVLFSGTAFLGLGLPIATAGIAVIAGDFSDEAGFGRVLNHLQVCYALGSFLFSTMAGVLADFTGGYVAAYLACAALFLLFFIMIHRMYRLIGRSASAGET